MIFTGNYIAGIDGGGTKTKLLLEWLSGGKKSFVFGPLNITGANEETVLHTLQEIFTVLEDTQGGLANCISLCIGTAGISNPAQRSFLSSFIENSGYTGFFHLVGDNEIALEGALQGSPGLLLASGTGSFCYGKNKNGTTAMIGGWGYLIGDEGSGYAIGRDITAAALAALDATGPYTVLLPAVKIALAAKDRTDIIKAIYTAAVPKEKLAALSTLLEPAVFQNDDVAIAILKKATEGLCALAYAARKRLNLFGETIALTGSVLQNCKSLNKAVCDQLRQHNPDILICQPLAEPANGALLLARQFIK